LPVLVLTRRRSEPDFTADDVAVVNPDSLAAHVRNVGGHMLLDERDRIKVTRAFRSA